LTERGVDLGSLGVEWKVFATANGGPPDLDRFAQEREQP
jgi:hypothetical protein